MGIRFLPITQSFLVQSRKFLYRDAQEMIIYQISYNLGGLEVKVISTSAPATPRDGRARRAEPESRGDSETSPKVPPMGGAFW